MPPVAIFQLLPVSLGGWGVREAALVIFLGALGIPGETALAASLCIGLSQILVGLPGGLIWLSNWDFGRWSAIDRRGDLTGCGKSRLRGQAKQDMGIYGWRRHYLLCQRS